MLCRFVMVCVAWKQHCFSIGVRRTDFVERANIQMSNDSVSMSVAVRLVTSQIAVTSEINEAETLSDGCLFRLTYNLLHTLM